MSSRLVSNKICQKARRSRILERSSLRRQSLRPISSLSCTLESRHATAELRRPDMSNCRMHLKKNEGARAYSHNRRSSRSTGQQHRLLSHHLLVRPSGQLLSKWHEPDLSAGRPVTSSRSVTLSPPGISPRSCVLKSGKPSHFIALCAFIKACLTESVQEV